MVANVDGFIEMPGDTVGLEIKTGSSYTLKGWGGKDGEEVPDDYYCQVQHYMAVLGLDRFVIFGLIGNCRVYRIVERNDEFIGELIETERSFWQLVEENNPVSAPLPTGKECDLEALLELGNPQNDSVVDLSGYDDMLQKYMGVCEDIKILQTEKKRMYQELIAAMGHAKYGESTEYRLSLSRYNVNRLDTKRLKVEHPEIYENYTKESEQARLYIKPGSKIK
jgi:predicted phage-related endonuclease